jgi:hypothetical protein
MNGRFSWGGKVDAKSSRGYTKALVAVASLLALALLLANLPSQRQIVKMAPPRSSQAVSIPRTAVDSVTDKFTVQSPRTNASLTFREFLSALGDPSDKTVRLPFVDALRSSRFAAFFFETPAFSQNTLDRSFEFVLVSAAHFVGMRADISSFSEFLGSKDGTSDVTVFSNLGRDAILVAPTPATGVDRNTYAHVAAFVRKAPRQQVDRLWQRVGQSALECADSRSFRWLSTSGGGRYYGGISGEFNPSSTQALTGFYFLHLLSHVIQACRGCMCGLTCDQSTTRIFLMKNYMYLNRACCPVVSRGPIQARFWHASRIHSPR